MRSEGRTILITGGGTGIGRGLAESFHARGNSVIIAGRRRGPLDEVAAANPGMRAATLDVGDAASVREFAERARSEFPTLDVLVNNAGLSRPEDIAGGKADPADAELILTTNVLGLIRLTTALLPQLRSRPESTIVNVSSGLAFVPLSTMPTYSASKAAVHSYTESLRYVLRGTTTDVLEIIPPYVQTDFSPGQATDPRAMPLGEFIAEVMSIIVGQPGATEVCVERCRPLRFADRWGKYDETFGHLNDLMSS